MRNTPRPHVKRPPYEVLGKRPGAELASHLSVGEGGVFEAGNGVLFNEKFKPRMWVGHVSLNSSKTDNVGAGLSACPSPISAPCFPP